MGLIEAYSIEQKRDMDAEEAYEEYWAGRLKDQHNFKCTGDNCTAQVTCACMNIPEDKLKKTPYFTIHEKNHSKDCSYVSGLQKINYEKKSGIATGSTNTKSYEMSFNFSPKSTDEGSGNKEPTRIKKQSENVETKISGYNNGHNLRTVDSLRSVVNKWKEYKERDVCKFYEINMERVLTFDSLFKGIYYKLMIERLLNEKFIYWGRAFVNKETNYDATYKIVFAEKLSYNGQLTRPSFLIYTNVIEKYHKKDLINRLSKVANSKKKVCDIYIYSELRIKESNGNFYINFDLKDLNLLDVRYLDSMEE